MQPAFQPGQIVLINCWAYLFHAPRVGEVVALWQEETQHLLIKRIVRQDGQAYFIQGDNPHDSLDSRHFGSVPRSTIVGKVIGRV